MDLGGGGLVAGDVTYEATDVGQSLDQLAREILRHLQAHKLTVVWLFDESGSMKDDQQAIREKFDRVASELKVNVDNRQESRRARSITRSSASACGYSITRLEKPTADIDVIRRDDRPPARRRERH